MKTILTKSTLKERDNYLKSLGINEGIDNNIDNVLLRIKMKLETLPC